MNFLLESIEGQQGYRQGLKDAIEILAQMLTQNPDPEKEKGVEEAKAFAERINHFKAEWVDDDIRSYSYDEEGDVLTMYARGGTGSLKITIPAFSETLKASPDGGHTLVDGEIVISYDCGVMTVDCCELGF